MKLPEGKRFLVYKGRSKKEIEFILVTLRLSNKINCTAKRVNFNVNKYVTVDSYDHRLYVTTGDSVFPEADDLLVPNLGQFFAILGIEVANPDSFETLFGRK